MNQFITLAKTIARRLPLVIVGMLLCVSGFLTAVHADGAGSSTLNAPHILSTGQQLVSSSGQYRVIMQNDGNLVMYGNGIALWASNTNATNAILAMQGDGNLVIYDGTGRPIWASNTNGTGSGNFLGIQDDGNLVVYTSSDVPVWASGARGNELYAPATLKPGYYLHSVNGQYKAIMQFDGNFVVYMGSTAIWASGKMGSGNYAAMQSDGNLVVYSSSGAPVWASNTGGTGSANHLAMQEDGNLVIYTSAGSAVWASKSGSGSSSQATTAINWAKQYLHQDYDVNLCLTFVAGAWAKAGVNIGSAYNAVTYWNNNPRGYQKHTDQNPPAGALVFWGTTQWSSDGHVALSMGSGQIISTSAYPYTGTNTSGAPDKNAVFIFSFSQRNPTTYHYLGWMMPQ